ncbi:MAG: hypothetical protein HOH33_15560 [Verrucomicrobia bacterium]|nr:hypothetical protein [Verrucomicrobiota bacterium]
MFEPLPIELPFVSNFSEPGDAQDNDGKYVPGVDTASSECGGVLESLKRRFQVAYYRLIQ